MPSHPTLTSYGRAMMIASLNAQQLIMLARRKPSSITTSITKTLGLIDEGRRPMTTLRGIKEKGRRLDLLCLSLVRALYSKQNNKKKKKPHHWDAFWDWGTGANSMSGFYIHYFLAFCSSRISCETLCKQRILAYGVVKCYLCRPIST